MKVLGIMGSPRPGGNTEIMLRTVLESVKSAGGVIEQIDLRILRIEECDGCLACWKDELCAKRDDMAAIYPKIAACDAMVFGTPVYWYGPTALLKAFLDRLVYFNCPEHRPKIMGKLAAAVIPFEEQDPSVADPLVACLTRSAQYLEMRFEGVALGPGLGPRGAVLSRPDILAECEALGQALTGKMR